MIKLKKESLQEFQKITAAIKKNTAYPALRFIKLDLIDGKHTFTKSNLNLTCIAEINGAFDKPYETILLDERVLFAFLGESVGEEIIIRIGAKAINLSDGINNINLPKEPPSNFPKIPELIQEASFLFTREHIGAIKIARKFANDSESAGNYQFIHINKKYIAAINHHFFYVNEKFEDLPMALLTPEQADVISSFDQDIMFESVGNHYFFISPTVRYIFTRQEGVTLDIPSIVSRLQSEGKKFNMVRNEFVNFCNIANVVSESPISLCSLTRSGSAKLVLIESSYERAMQREINVDGEFDEFNFNSRLISDPMRAIPNDILNCKTMSNCLVINGDEEWYCFMGTQK